MIQNQKRLHWQYWLWLSLMVLPFCLTVEPLQAQLSHPTQLTQLPNPEPANLSQPQNPLPRDEQPPSTAPLSEPEPPLPLPPPEQLLQPPASPTPTPESTPERGPTTIVVKQFNVTGSTVFSPEELAKVTAAFINRPLSLAELFQARSAVTQLYIDQGYITSGAYLPPQKLQGGVVEIRVVEGSLEEIQVTGTRRLNPNYVRSRIAIATQQPLNRRRLLEALQLLQLDPLIQTLSAELSAGSRPGTNLLEVQVTEADSFNTQVVLDNGRSPSVGSFRRRLQVNEGNLLGQGDGFSIGYTNTDGSNALDVGYSFPLNPRNGTLSFNYGTTSSNVIEPPFNQLDITASSRYYELTLRQPVIRTTTQELALGLIASRRESEAALLGGEIPFPASGTDEQGRTRISAVRFFQEWTQRNSQEVIAVRSQLSLGLNVLDATINPTAPDSRFVAWRGQAQWVRLLAPDTLLLLRGDLQLADRPLVALEQFGVGGQESVRGYRQDLLLSDNGAFASVEVRFPILRAPQVGGVLQLTPFVDLGTAWNNSSPNPSPATLASVGLGLRWQQGDRFTSRLDWGIPLVSTNSSGSTLQESGLYFSVIYNPF